MPRPSAGFAASICACLFACGCALWITIAAAGNSMADDDAGHASGTNSATDQPVTSETGGTFNSAGQSTESDNVTSLVTKLGDAKFAVRENASNQLVQKGIAAKPELVAALESTDAEVRFRAKRILAAIVEADFQRRLSSFAADTDGKLGVDLPGWTTFKQVAGDDKTARDVFVEMQQAEGPLLEADQQGPKQAAEKLVAELAGEPSAVDRAMMARMRGRAAVVARSGTSNLGSILTWLFVAADEQVPITDDISGRIIMLPENQAFQQAMQASSVQANRRAEVFRRILGHWVARNDVSANYVSMNLGLACTFDLKEGVSPAIAILKQPQPTADLKYQLALLMLARYGGKQQLPLLEPYLKQTTVCYDSQGPANQRIQTEVRDLARFAALKLADQDVKKFGFSRAVNLQVSRLNLQTIGFEADADQNEVPTGTPAPSRQREAAIQKWEAWQKGQESAASEKKEASSATENSG
jgi:hypothetical protein